MYSPRSRCRFNLRLCFLFSVIFFSLLTHSRCMATNKSSLVRWCKYWTNWHDLHWVHPEIVNCTGVSALVQEIFYIENNLTLIELCQPHLRRLIHAWFNLNDICSGVSFRQRKRLLQFRGSNPAISINFLKNVYIIWRIYFIIKIQLQLSLQMCPNLIGNKLMMMMMRVAVICIKVALTYTLLHITHTHTAQQI